jgi:hypothetical protein
LAAADDLVVSFQHRGDNVTRDCLGNSPGAAGVLTVNTISLVGNELRCNGQALVGDGNAAQNTQTAVEDFQVWYWVINALGQQRRMTATDVPANGGWQAVDAVEVCLQLRGVASNYPVTGTYRNCRDATPNHDGRLHQAFRGTFKLRNRM